MKTMISALALAALFANPAAATKFEMSDHAFERIVHVEVVGGHHEKSGKRK